MSETSRKSVPSDSRIFWRVLLLAAPLGIAALFTMQSGLVLRTWNIPSGSMAPTLRVGSFQVSSQAAYGYSRATLDWFKLPISGRWPQGMPGHGDVVVFRLPKDQRTVFVSRVIGLPGDKVQMRGGRVVLNGRAVDRVDSGSEPDPNDSAQKLPAFKETLPNGRTYRILKHASSSSSDDTQVFDVPAGHLFFLGDNRDNSLDSRIPGGPGFVPVELVIGKILFVE